jgi:hypothetical protein
MRTIKDGKPFPLDYIMQLPKMVTSKIMELTRDKLVKEMQESGKVNRSAMERKSDIDHKVQKYAAKSFVLENKLKNVVIRMLEGIRQ